MKLAVCLTTCERSDLTLRTVRSFRKFNDPSRFMLLHADDASREHIEWITHDHGFETVAVHPERRGAQECRRSVVHAARDRGATHVLLLENDWECVKPFPWEIAEDLLGVGSPIYTFRLYGHYRVRGNPNDRLSNRPCVETHAGTRKRAVWKDVAGVPGIEAGSIHMGTAPCVTAIDDLCWLLSSADCAADMMVTSAQIPRLTARPKNSDNWFWDIGFLGTGKGHGTPGFIA